MNSKIILAKNIHIDRDYVDVLSYTESQMLSLCQQNQVASADDFSFLDYSKKTIFVEFSYDLCLQANYIAFQNPYYSNKWFFAWIDDVIYKNDGNCELRFTVDAWSTWFDYWLKKPCFVVREHVSSDGYGEHTIDEGLNTGPHISNFSTDFGSLNYLDCHIVMATTISPTNGTSVVGGGTYGGIQNGAKYFLFNNPTNFNNALDRIASNGNSASIVAVFMAPDWLTGYNDVSFDSNGIAEITSTYVPKEDISIAIPLNPTKIGDYVVKNKKLFTFPFCSYIISNNSGGALELHLEDFKDDGTHVASAKIYGVVCPGCSIRLVPQNYKIHSDNLNLEDNNEYGLTLGKFPVCGFQNDAYTNWLTQSSVNRELGTLSSIANIGVGLGEMATAPATGGLTAIPGVGKIGGGISGLIGNEVSKWEHSFNPIEARGNVNSGDVTYAMSKLCYSGYFMTIKEEYARRIDQWFNRFGYKINEIKLPNIKTRPYWNFLEIGPDECVGYGEVPSNFMSTINNICRKGVTIWHDHANLGNYALDNYIV